jgi:hypothetical protein
MMKKYLAVPAVLAVGTLGLTACGQTQQSSSKQAVAQVTTTATQTVTQTPTVQKPPAPEVLHVGHMQTLHADNEDMDMNVTVTSVVPLQGDELNTPDNGKHYVGVNLKYSNPSENSDSYDDSPDNETSLVTSDGHTIDSDAANLDVCSNNGDIKVAPGATRQTCVTFQVPDNQKVTQVEVALDSGFDTAVDWSINTRTQEQIAQRTRQPVTNARGGYVPPSTSNTVPPSTSDTVSSLTPTYCSNGVYIGADVSCSLAENVFSATYSQWSNNGNVFPSSLSGVHSPVTGQNYDLNLVSQIASWALYQSNTGIYVSIGENALAVY